MAKTFDAVLAEWIATAFVRLDAEGAPLFRWKDELVSTHEYLHRLLSFEPALMLALEERVSQILHLGSRAVHALNAQRRALGVPTTSHAPLSVPRPASPATPDHVAPAQKVGSRFLVRPGEQPLTESQIRIMEARHETYVERRAPGETVLRCLRCDRQRTVPKPVYQMTQPVRDWVCTDAACRREGRAKALRTMQTYLDDNS